MFNDRRTRKDRRHQHRPEHIPPEGCRRHQERRDFYRHYQPTPWWLRTNYVEELEPPLLDGGETEAPQRVRPRRNR